MISGADFVNQGDSSENPCRGMFGFQNFCAKINTAFNSISCELFKVPLETGKGYLMLIWNYWTLVLFNVLDFFLALPITLIKMRQKLQSGFNLSSMLTINSCFSILRKSHVYHQASRTVGGYQKYPALMILVSVEQPDWCQGSRAVLLWSISQFHCERCCQRGGFRVVNQTALNGAGPRC